jgi:trk system potassium uptake protein TrkH
MNFALLFRVFVRRKPRAALHDEEARLYLTILAVMSAVVATVLWKDGVQHGEAAIRHGAFQVVSMMTTTGYANTDFITWPALALMILVFAMLIGGSAGSTGGAIKVVRHLLLAKILRRELRQAVHPEAVMPIRFNGAVVDERTLRAVAAFILLYVGIFAAGAGLLALDAAFQGPPLSAMDAVTAAATTLGNVGPGIGFAGPMGSFEPFSDFSTGVMIALMWLGRLEIVPVLLLVTRGYWRV